MRELLVLSNYAMLYKPKNQLRLLRDLPNSASFIKASSHNTLILEHVNGQHSLLMPKKCVQIAKLIQAPRFDCAVVRTAVQVVTTLLENQSRDRVTVTCTQTGNCL